MHTLEEVNAAKRGLVFNHSAALKTVAFVLSLVCSVFRSSAGTSGCLSCLSCSFLAHIVLHSVVIKLLFKTLEELSYEESGTEDNPQLTFLSIMVY